MWTLFKLRKNIRCWCQSFASKLVITFRLHITNIFKALISSRSFLFLLFLLEFFTFDALNTLKQMKKYYIHWNWGSVIITHPQAKRRASNILCVCMCGNAYLNLKTIRKICMYNKNSANSNNIHAIIAVSESVSYTNDVCLCVCMYV